MLIPDVLNSPLEFEIVQQSQYLIVDESKNYEPVCVSYKKYVCVGIFNQKGFKEINVF